MKAQIVKYGIVVLIVVGIALGLYFGLKKKAGGSSPPSPQPVGAFAFECSPGLGCQRVNQAPNKASGLYSDIQSCNAGCHLDPKKM